MDEFRWILMSLFMIGMPHSTVTGQYQRFTVRDGDDVTLPCMNVRNDQNQCDGTTWMFNDFFFKSTETLVHRGKISRHFRYRSDRLGVTENCSLVLKEVSLLNVGHYTCRQDDKAKQQRENSVVDLSVVSMTEGVYSYFTVRDGDDMTIPCIDVKDDQDECDRTDWTFRDSENILPVTLYENGKIHQETGSKADRLRLTENCSLVVKNVTVEDVGHYTCRQYDLSGHEHDRDSNVHLSVVSKSSSSSESEYKKPDEVMLFCSVRTYDECKHRVRWLHEGNKKDVTDMKLPHGFCFATFTFPTSHQMNYDLLKCEVTDGDRRKQQFTIRRQTGAEETGRDAAATVTETSTKKTERDEKSSVLLNRAAPSWFYIVAAASSAAVLITVVVLIWWKKTKGNQTQTGGNTADPEDGVFHSSISYSKMTKHKTLGKQKDDEDEAVIFSPVNVSPFTDEAS